jgi:hypothetical protein
VNTEMHWVAIIERVWRCNWCRILSVLRDELRSRERASMEMQLQTEMEGTQRYIGRPCSSKFEHAVGCGDRLNSEMHSDL